MALFSELATKMTLDNTSFISAVKQAEMVTSSFSNKAMSTFSKVTLGIGAATAAGGFLFNSLKKSADAVGNLYDKTQGLNITFDKFMALDFAASKAGVSTEKLQNILAKMQENIGRASLGDKGVNQSLERLGISLKELQSLSPDRQFALIASAMRKIGDNGQAAAIGAKILGKNIKDSLALVNSDLDQVIQKFKELDIALSDEEAAKLDNLSEDLDLLSKRWDTTWAKMAIVAVPVLNNLITAFNSFEGAVSKVNTVLETFVGMRKEELGFGPIANYDPNEQMSKVKFDIAKFIAAGNTQRSWSAVSAPDTRKFTSGLELNDKERFDQIINGLKSRDDILKASFDNLGSAVDKAKDSLSNFTNRMEQLESLRNDKYADNKDMKQLTSEEFDDVARDLIDRQLRGTLTGDYANAKFSQLKGITQGGLEFNERGELEEFSTSNLKNQLKELQDLILGNKGKNEVAITVSPSSEFDAKITKISENSFTNLIAKEAVGTNR